MAAVRQIAFGPFTLDLATRELVRGPDRCRVHLSPKAYDLLVLLIQNRPAALAKSTVQARLWPKTYVSEATLASLVTDLRTALGETGRNPVFIRTLHGFGYAFSGSSRDVGRSENHKLTSWLVCNGVETALPEGTHLIGRDSGATLALNSPTVSRHHAQILVNGMAAAIADLGSKNGTYVRGELIHGEVLLCDGDCIRVGSFELVYRALCDTASTETQR